MNIFEELQTNEKGLTSLEVEKRLEKYGRNELPEKKPEGFLSIFINQFKSPLIYILLGAGVIVSLMGEWADAMVILAVLMLNAIIGSFQEGKAQNTIRALKNFVETRQPY